jgi:hypothetical protein
MRLWDLGGSDRDLPTKRTQGAEDAPEDEPALDEAQRATFKEEAERYMAEVIDQGLALEAVRKERVPPRSR